MIDTTTLTPKQKDSIKTRNTVPSRTPSAASTGKVSPSRPRVPLRRPASSPSITAPAKALTKSPSPASRASRPSRLRPKRRPRPVAAARLRRVARRARTPATAGSPPPATKPRVQPEKSSGRGIFGCPALFFMSKRIILPGAQCTSGVQAYAAGSLFAQVEDIQKQEGEPTDPVADAFGRLLQVLADKDLLTAPEIVHIVENNIHAPGAVFAT